MSYAIVYIESPNRAIKYYDTELGAKIGLAAANRRAGRSAFKYVTSAEVIAADYMVTVINLVTGQPVQIRESMRGTCCDPSTHRYHEM